MGERGRGRGDTATGMETQRIHASPAHPLPVTPSPRLVYLFVAAFGFETKVSQLAERGHAAARL